MTLPGYAAETSLNTRGGRYRGARSGPRAYVGSLVVAQQDPCAIRGGGGGGGGGTPPPPRLCPPGFRCCEPAPGGRCHLCAPINAQCP
jgi:hypothetical protein